MKINKKCVKKKKSYYLDYGDRARYKRQSQHFEAGDSQAFAISNHIIQETA